MESAAQYAGGEKMTSRQTERSAGRDDRSDVEAKVHHVAFVHDVFLALEP
jgi:hypothetical protein